MDAAPGINLGGCKIDNIRLKVKVFNALRLASLAVPGVNQFRQKECEKRNAQEANQVDGFSDAGMPFEKQMRIVELGEA